MIPITAVDVRDAEALVIEVLRSGVLAQGPMVARLEEGFARLTGTAHAVAVNSGTAALSAALEVLDLQPGDEVVTSPFTFVATLNAILERGATVRFADVTREDFALDPDAVATVLGPRTKVLMPVHLYGQTADMGKLVPLAEEHGLALVEDAAQALGASFLGKPAGSFGLGCFSLYATKNVTTGEGGVITCDDAEVADRLRVLRNQGMRDRYRYEVAGHNYRMSELHAAVGIPQLARFDELVAARRRNARQLTTGLTGTPGLAVPQVLPGRAHMWHQYTVLIGPHAMLSREELAAELADRGIATGIYYPKLVFDHDCFRGHPLIPAVSPSDFPVAKKLSEQAISLPVHPALSESDVDTIVREVREALGA
ncbi:DegT/DnrJ/EryC1/StrS family aminotransferase [Amycolatopsis sp. K13G38]|uniref:DegT/DnrJ/EryC1/StrS family aminotransferase n=1 Tax=Amycolatopsis acididurans TaxID=2724524 RepID=A0ABX1J136_9PSEU|nr:DegT/DnrJ/EryC1/StrS family aminotransferase [Amycolatopsis acididurans]NKQ53490.1 DegT/DnrJ/EryC1/StrS family aminotransferase [Amycolatopsis acididurans]